MGRSPDRSAINLRNYASLAEIKSSLTDRTEISLEIRTQAIEEFSNLITCPYCGNYNLSPEISAQSDNKKIYECPQCDLKIPYWHNDGDIILLANNKKLDRFGREVRDLGCKINPGERVASLGRQFIVVISGGSK